MGSRRHSSLGGLILCSCFEQYGRDETHESDEGRRRRGGGTESDEEAHEGDESGEESDEGEGKEGQGDESKVSVQADRFLPFTIHQFESVQRGWQICKAI